MESFLFALASLVILVPIIYFLPLGFSSKGKVLLIIIAFFLANFGLLVKFIIPMWQTLLVMLLLVLLSSIILKSRLTKIFYSTNLKKEKSELIDFNQDEESEMGGKEKIETDSLGSQQSLSFTNEEAPIINEDEILFVSHSNVPINESENVLEDEGSILESKIDLAKGKDIFQDDTQSLIDENGEEMDEDITFLLNREKLMHETMENEYSNKLQHDKNLGYMSEIEKLLDEEALLDIQLAEVAVTLEDDSDVNNNNDIPLLKFDKLTMGEENNHTDDADESIFWDDEIEPIKEFKNTKQGD